jgi:hypothetical protein
MIQITNRITSTVGIKAQVSSGIAVLSRASAGAALSVAAVVLLLV